MAQWVNRSRADGGTSIQIKWRMNGHWQTETFTDPRLASEFRTAVEQAGHRWPADWIKGEGWRVEEPTPEPIIVTFDEVATGYFAAQEKRVTRGKIKPYTIHRYRREYTLHLEETLAHLPFREISDLTIEEWIDEEIADGAAPKSIANHHVLQRRILLWGLIGGPFA